MKTAVYTIIIVSLALGSASGQSDQDVLGKVLEEVGFTRADLGYQPKGYWNRFPLDIPYRLTSFNDLFAKPLKLIDYSTVMANTVELYMDPTYADTASDGLYKLVYNLGVDKKLGGLRSYPIDLLPAPEGDKPFEQAVRTLFRMAGEDMSDIQRQQFAEFERLPDSVQTIIAQLLVNLADAIKWRNLAFRNCDPEDLQKAIEIRDLAISQEDGLVYYPELDDIAANIDFPSLHYAALKIASAAEQSELSLRSYVDSVDEDLTIDIPTPFGKILILTPGSSPLVIPDSGCLLVFDFGRPITYSGCVGATATLENPVSVLIDLGGNDNYQPADEHLPNAGVGLCGIGMVIDSDGNDRYEGSVYAQGAGLFGVGVLLDRNGDDIYNAQLSAQGCGYFGIGLCLDISGNDKYYLYCDGQGLGGVGGGIGVCASFDGNDQYVAEKDPEVYDHADYHSQHKINASWVHGAGKGRRGDITDGHSWAGGLGAIIDIHGNDHYLSGNFSLGVSYWFATGIAVDRYGDDIYESCYFTQGSGAHYCNSLLLDESGNDRHELYETAGAALGFGWDFANALLINKGGDDSYRAKMISMGLAQIRSNAFLIDTDGNDRYLLGKGTPGLGEATYRAGMDKPLPLLTYYYYTKSFGGFIDIGGEDTYHEFEIASDSATATTDTLTTEHPLARDNSLWLQPARADSTFGFNNFGVGLDIRDGIIPELLLWESQ
ncbi:MAG: hypothetical protein JSV52_08920 [Candidatus Zixiibacteriota bacterium]|nr:MAG: hypothetical protein JSV52_08920 [candidate division Zixibacteria bacterium]